jgi:hypothetical protein
MELHDPWDLTDPTLFDRVRAAAWDPPTLPLFEGEPWPTPTGSSSSGAGPLYSVLGLSHPLPVAGMNYSSGTDAPSEQSGLIEHLMRMLAQSAPAQGMPAAAKPNLDAATAALPSFNGRWSGPSVEPATSPPPAMMRNPFFGAPEDDWQYPVSNPAPVRPDGAAPAGADINQPATAVPLPRPRPEEALPRGQPPFTDLIPIYPLPREAPDPRPGAQFYPGARGYPLAVPDDHGPGPFEHRWWDGNPWWLRNMSAPRSDTHFTSPPNIQSLTEELGRQNVDVNDFIDRILFAESRGNPYLSAGPKGGLGAAQFVKGTWREELALNRPELISEDPWLAPTIGQRPQDLAGKDPTGAKDKAVDIGGLSNMRRDYALSRQRAAEYANKLTQLLVRKNFDATTGNIYTMYVAGPNDGIKILEALRNDPNTPALDVAPIAVKANRGLAGPNPTVRELHAAIENRIANARPDLLPFRRAPK